MGLKTNGVRCTHIGHGVTAHLHYCTIHHRVYNRRGVAHVAGTCHRWIGNTHYCGRQCADNGLLFCERHIDVERRREERNQAQREANARIDQVVLEYTQRLHDMNWRQMVDDITVNPRGFPSHTRWIIARRYFFLRAHVEPEFNEQWQFELYWAWVVRGRIGNPPDLTDAAPWIPVVIDRNALVVIAGDVQNVHTRVVSDQTNKGLEKLLEASKNARLLLRTPESFAARWLKRGYGNWDDVVRIVGDMKYWYGMATCKTSNDRLYKKALDGLYRTIKNAKDDEVQAELFKRAFEECLESVGMCCEGHISRLSNVMVGFDDAFEPPVPFGEILQNKMAAISAMEIEPDEKRTLATEFLNEFAVPDGERSAWLEAF